MIPFWICLLKRNQLVAVDRFGHKTIKVYLHMRVVFKQKSGITPGSLTRGPLLKEGNSVAKVVKRDDVF